MCSDIAVIGLAVMGENLARNFARNGYRVSLYNRTEEKTKSFISRWQENFTPTYSIEEMVKSLDRPRKIFMMVKAGVAVDKTIEQLLPYLETGDILIDGGNSYFEDTLNREILAKEIGVHYIGCGVSGGEDGALNGPSLMPGGDRGAYLQIEKMLQDVSAKAPDPCVTYIGPGGAGHFVKMIHNGIEYGDMQLIAEAYSFLKIGLGYNNDKIASVFSKWNDGELNSFLIEVTSKVLVKKDSDGTSLVDKILDKAGQKGTGKWTSIKAMDFGVPLGTITSSVDARYVSSRKDMREKLSKVYPHGTISNEEFTDELVQKIKDALFASKIISYTQGLDILKEASDKYNWSLNLSEIAKIWRGGCIIRAQFLDDISDAYTKERNLDNLLLSSRFSEEVKKRIGSLRTVVSKGVQAGLPLMTMTSSLSYFDAMTSKNLSANLIQAQRDFFGAHTFERVDKPGVFHEQWEV